MFSFICMFMQSFVRGKDVSTRTVASVRITNCSAPVINRCVCVWYMGAMLFLPEAFAFSLCSVPMRYYKLKLKDANRKQVALALHYVTLFAGDSSRANS